MTVEQYSELVTRLVLFGSVISGVIILLLSAILITLIGSKR